ncbi:MAG: hypothetical protein HY644_03600 [Acidobacteria bacterium]|nr:hypothetical protein [Acidobacteriota bacterium]
MRSYFFSDRAQKEAVGLIRWIVRASFVLLANPFASAQESPAASVNLGSGSAAPGEHALLAVTLSTTDHSPMAEVLLEISFPGKLISFKKAIQSATTTSGEVKARVENPRNQAEQNLLRVDISAAKGIPQGELLKLAFEVSKEAEVYQVVKLKNLKQTVRSVEGRAIQARGMDGVIMIFPEKTPLSSCFFYMH